ncbi:MAG: acetylxylan esterase [Fibrobacter sp.]|uniref:sialate O-acetylesterase n=1 Tax=Fibrobacter sp. TaxID=35828 RepID=UPI001B0A9720|nr:sialate O-acetylesterase [Fibrobacter sp.]MBO7061682.1 acetylxylan esterase [Fibrobacter sp.]
MKKINIMGSLIGVALMTASTFAAPDPNFHIYLAFGQSNMEGQGDIGNEDKNVDERFQLLWSADAGSCNQGASKGKWIKAVPPLAHCQGAKLGPADYFGRTMVEKTDSKIKVGIIVVAVAGCSIDLFDKDGYANYARSQQSWMTQRINTYGGNPYGRLIEMAKKAQEDGVIKGIIFHQGETDAGNGQWPSKVKKVYDNIIKDLGLGNDIPFLAGEVLRSGVSSGANNNIAKLPQQSNNFYVVSSEGFNQALGDGQNVHFTSSEYRDFGKRYAEKMIEVLGTEKLKPVEGSASPASSSSAAAESSSSGKAPASSGSSSSGHHHSSHGSSSSGAALSSCSAADVSSAANPESSSAAGSDAVRSVSAKGVSIGKAVVSQNAIIVPVSLARASRVNVSVYSVLGKQVMSMDASFAAGENTVSLDAAKLPVGNYMISVQAGAARSTARIDIAR